MTLRLLWSRVNRGICFIILTLQNIQIGSKQSKIGLQKTKPNGHEKKIEINKNEDSVANNLMHGLYGESIVKEHFFSVAVHVNFTLCVVSFNNQSLSSLSYQLICKSERVTPCINSQKENLVKCCKTLLNLHSVPHVSGKNTMVNKVNKDDDFVKYLTMDMARSKTFTLLTL